MTGMPAPLPAMVAKLLARLQEIAAIGEPCPSNDAIAKRYGFGSPTGGNNMMRQLVDRGLIEIETMNRGRVVTIVATGQRTALPKRFAAATVRPEPSITAAGR